MEAILRYTLLASICMTVFYIFYILVLRKTYAFQTIRYFLVISILISVLFPFQKHEIELKLIPEKTNQEMAIRTQNVTPVQEPNKNEIPTPTPNHQIASQQKNDIGILDVALFIYFTIAIILFAMLILNIINILRFRMISARQCTNEIDFFNSQKVKSPFTFFSWIFINSSDISSQELKKIVLHEKVHSIELHTIDILISELMKVIFWFNPVVWLLSKAIKQNHEYIADEGVIDTGIDKVGYQTLLLNQITEGKFLTLSSGFNHSLIKKRIVMMTKDKFKQKTGLRLISVIPVALILFLGISCVNGQKKQTKEPLAVIAPTKMNVFYVGVDNPVSIAVSGYEKEDIEVEITNGTIRGENGRYVVNPKLPGNTHISVFANKELIAKYEFRVKHVPDPVAAVGKHFSGNITKEEFLNAGGVKVILSNFDFDISFEVVSFVMSTTVPGSYTIIEDLSDGDKFSKAQIELISNAVKFQKIMIEEIEAKGPDGAIRKLSPMVFTIVE